MIRGKCWLNQWKYGPEESNGSDTDGESTEVIIAATVLISLTVVVCIASTIYLYKKQK